MNLQRQAVLLCSLFVVLIGLTSTCVRAEVNITLEDTASQIIYSPPACGLTLLSDGTEAQTVTDCNSAWRIIAAQGAAGGTLTTTSGPTDGSGDVIPQLFLSVRAHALYVKTTPSSTAIVNVSVSTNNPILTVKSELNSSLEFISIVGLPEDRISTLSLTFVQSDRATHVDIDTITVSISDNKYHNTVRCSFATAVHGTSYRHPINHHTHIYPIAITLRTNKRCCSR
ncbi:hypothetical protein GY45DRAFT_1345209 [Cubamyces sp. BRFM 1775]|nr:hypothetical protein GY45DRAFT_1345209 [Cubamyces sp. BRFM 1775]